VFAFAHPRAATYNGDRLSLQVDVGSKSDHSGGKRETGCELPSFGVGLARAVLREKILKVCHLKVIQILECVWIRDGTNLSQAGVKEPELSFVLHFL